MAEIDVEAIKARCEAATEGPWEQPGPPLCRDWTRVYWRAADRVRRFICSTTGRLDGSEHGARAEADAEFIAHAREDVPELVAEVERLRAQLATIRRRMAIVFRGFEGRELGDDVDAETAVSAVCGILLGRTEGEDDGD